MHDEQQIEIVRAIDTEIAHVWMIRTFLKHADESQDDEVLRDIVRDLYDFILAVGPIDEVNDPKVYLKMAKKKLCSNLALKIATLTIARH